jgi:hypothetical protein
VPQGHHFTRLLCGINIKSGNPLTDIVEKGLERLNQ